MELPPALFADVLECAKRYAPAPGPDKRMATRRELSVPAKISRVVAGVEEAPTLSVIRDLSPIGIGLVHAQPMKEGDIFIVHLPRPAGESLSVQCVVTRWCRLGNELYIIGATYQQMHDGKA